MNIRLFAKMKSNLFKYLLLNILMLVLNSTVHGEDENMKIPDKGKDWIIPELNIEMVWIEQMGIWVGKYPITNEQYSFYKEVYSPPPLFYGRHTFVDKKYPAVNISYITANEYIDWLNNREMKNNRLPQGMSYRMPTKDEWIKFCKCGDNRIYPWGDEWPPKYGNYADITAQKRGSDIRTFFIRGFMNNYDDGFVTTCPVEKSGKNTWGLYGVGGNVKEWVFGELKNTEKTNLSVVDKLPMAEICGSSWLESEESQLRCETTDKKNAGFNPLDLGFRLVLAPPASVPRIPQPDTGKATDDKVK